MPKVRIGQWQLVAMLVTLVFPKAIGFSAGLMILEVGRDGWLSMLLAFLSGFAMILVVVWLARRFPDEQPMQYVPRLVGRPLGALLLLLLAVFFVGAFITAALALILHVSDYLMTETPLFAFIFVFSLLCAYGAYLGIEVAARLGVWGMLMAVAIGVLMVMGTVDKFDYTRLLPLLDHGLTRTALASRIAGTDVAIVVAGVMMLLPIMGQPGRWLRAAWWGLAIGMAVTVIWPVFEISVLGPQLTAQYLVSCMQLARTAQLSIYLHRYELIMVLVWTYAVLTQSIVCLYGACEMTAAALPWRIRRGWLIIGVTLAILAPEYYVVVDRERYAVFLRSWWPATALPLAYGIPLLLALVALLRPGVRAAAGGQAAPAGAGGGAGNSQT